MGRISICIQYKKDSEPFWKITLIVADKYSELCTILNFPIKKFFLSFLVFVWGNLNSRNTYHDKKTFAVKSQKVCMKCQQSNIL